MWKRHPKLLRFWQKYTLWSLCWESEIVWFSSDDVHQRVRKWDIEIRLPRRLWRPYCWRYGHEENYGECVQCGMPMEYRA